MGKPFDIKGSLPDPAMTAARLLTQNLRAAGIGVAGEPRSTQEKPAGPADSRVIASFESPSLAAIQLKLNKQSFNLYAEMMLMHTARAAGDGTRSSGIKAEEAYLKELGVPLEGFHITDGSGLSRSNAVTAAGMAKLMAALQGQAHFPVWKGTLPVLGVDGDLRNRETSSPLRGKVSAKTGLINRVRGLCGYLETKSGRTVTFGLFANDYAKSWKQVDGDFDSLLRAVHDEY
jgi:D-alanyl-D-alanine carboxypeptidase/D-alanyl-D-alanine-endopeptidase (penicillin-binding protein 4)